MENDECEGGYEHVPCEEFDCCEGEICDVCGDYIG